MKYDFFELFYRNVKSTSEAYLFDETEYEKGLTFKQMDELSGKVYSFLKKSGIGNEDFVIVYMDKSARHILAMLGILKAGAAYILLDDTVPFDRMKTIQKDCNAKLVITDEIWSKILEEPVLSGNEERDDHSLAWATYTSGSTGKPKGVLLEYGTHHYDYTSIKDLFIPGNFAYPSSTAFTAFIFFANCFLMSGICKMYIPSFNTTKDLNRLKKYFVQNNINNTFYPPSMLPVLSDGSFPTLTNVIIAGDSLENYTPSDLKVSYAYGSSEAGFAVTNFKPDKSYDIVPTGYLTEGVNVVIKDVAGRTLPFDEVGEICIENNFMRGYLNLPEETAKSYVDGYFKSGDLGLLTTDGLLKISGRKSDTVKINGNRVSTLEVEAQFRKNINVTDVHVSSFKRNQKAYLCAYYINSTELNIDEVKEELARKLPSYMIPTYYMKLDFFPVKSNGKIDRLSLPVPQITCEKYVAPNTDFQKKLCKAFEDTLSIEKVGITDDFFALGGDSLFALQLVSALDLEDFSINYIYRGKTAQQIEKIYISERNVPKSDNHDLLKYHPLTAEQSSMYYHDLKNPNTTMYNLGSLIFKIDNQKYDMERFAKSLSSAIRNHYVLLTKWFEKDGQIMSIYKPEDFADIIVEKISEEKFGQLQKTLVKPYSLLNSYLFRFRVFETEKSGYFFFDIHHGIFDGSSLKVFLNNIINAYNNNPMQKCYYHDLLLERQAFLDTPLYDMAKTYFENTYGNTEWSYRPKYDFTSAKNIPGMLTFDLDSSVFIKEKNAHSLSENELFITINAIVTALYNNEKNVCMSWIYSARTDSKKKSTVGLLYKERPIGITFETGKTLEDIFDSVKYQIEKGIEYSSYSSVNIEAVANDNVPTYIFFQKDIFDLDFFDTNIKTEKNVIFLDKGNFASEDPFDMEILEQDGKFLFNIKYNASLYKKESIEYYRELFTWVYKYLTDDKIELAKTTFGDLKEGCDFLTTPSE